MALESRVRCSTNWAIWPPHAKLILNILPFYSKYTERDLPPYEEGAVITPIL